ERDTRIEVWDALVRSEGDKRYCLTVRDWIDNPKDRTVGSFCSELAHFRLCGVYLEHLPVDPIKDGRRIRLPISIGDQIGDLAKWRAQRKDKAMYELQIEVCEAAIAALGKVEGVPQKDVQAAKAAIEAEIRKLRESKKPIYQNGLPLG